jgi:hypothetical protein
MKCDFSKHRMWKAARLMGCLPSCRQPNLRYAPTTHRSGMPQCLCISTSVCLGTPCRSCSTRAGTERKPTNTTSAVSGCAGTLSAAPRHRTAGCITLRSTRTLRQHALRCAMKPRSPLNSDVEAVEKPLFEPQKSLRMARSSSRHFHFCLIGFPSRRIASADSLPQGPSRLLRIPVMRQLLDVVHQAEELPLRIHLPLSSQREAIQPLVVADVAEHRLHRGEASPVQRRPRSESMARFMMSV